MPTDLILHYDNHRLDIVPRDGQSWFRSGQIAPPLGLSERQVRKLQSRHAGKFTSRETTLMILPTPGGMQEVRVFSMRGLMKLAIYARTDQSIHFHDWLLNVADGKIRQSAPRQGSLALPPSMPMGTEARRLAEHLRSVAQDPAVQAELDALLGGRADLPPDPALDALILDMEEVRARRRLASEAETEWKRRVQMTGYDPEAVTREIERRRRKG